MTEQARPALTDRLHAALEVRAAAAPGSHEFDRAQAEVDRLVLMFVHEGPDRGRERLSAPAITLAQVEH